MNYLVTGGTGLVGKQLVDALKKDNNIYVLTRSDRTNETNVHYINWSNEGFEKLIPNIDVVINLAGASLQHRWTASHKESIMASRIETTQRLFDLFKDKSAPKVMFNASAVGYYPPSKSIVYNEQDAFYPHDFLSEVVYKWETTAKQFETLGTRVVLGRFGVVFSNEGGALPMMVKPYRYYIGGKLGDGNQLMSWIHIDDLIQGILYLIHHDIDGAVNLTSPEVLSQDELGKHIGSVLNKPHYLPAPAAALKLILGEQSAMVLKTQGVLPQRLMDAHFNFEYPTIQLALEDLVQHEGE